MRSSQKRQIVRAVASVVDGECVKDRLVVVTPRGRVLRGFYLENSSDPEGVYVWVFVQPLYVPAATVVFDFGKRLGRATKIWGPSDVGELAAVVRSEGKPFCVPISSPNAFAGWELLEGRVDPRAMEAKGYSLIASGNYVEGARVLQELARSIVSVVPWMIELKRRVEYLTTLVDVNPGAADDMLWTWEAQTVNALGVQHVY